MVGARDIPRSLREDRGFSLTELIVVLGVLGIVIAGAYALSYVTTKSSQVTARHATFSREVGVPLATLEIYLQQNTELEAPDYTDHKITFIVDRDLDGFVERCYLEADADGDLTFEIWEAEGTRTDTTQTMDFLMTDDCANFAEGIPLIRYFDYEGSEIASSEARPSSTRSVIVRIEVDTDDGERIAAEREIHFRNRDD